MEKGRSSDGGPEAETSRVNGKWFRDPLENLEKLHPAPGDSLVQKNGRLAGEDELEEEQTSSRWGRRANPLRGLDKETRRAYARGERPDT